MPPTSPVWVWLERINTGLALLVSLAFVVARLYFYFGPERASKRLFSPLATSRAIRGASQWFIALVGFAAIVLSAIHLLSAEVLPPSVVVSQMWLALAGILLLGCDVWITESRRGGERLLDTFDSNVRDAVQLMQHHSPDRERLRRFVLGRLATAASLVGPDPAPLRTGRACVYRCHQDHLKIWEAQCMDLNTRTRNVFSLQNIDAVQSAEAKMGAVTRVYLTGQPKLMNDYRHDPDYLVIHMDQERPKYTGSLMLPIMPPGAQADAKPLGVLCIDKSSRAPFTQRDLSVATVIGRFLTLAIVQYDQQAQWDGRTF